MSGDWHSIDVGGSPMRTYMAESSRQAPGVLVCMHAPGIDPFIMDMCHRLAEAGFVAAAPDVYHRHAETHDLGPLDRMKLLRDEEVIVDFQAASAFLAKESDPERQLAVGFCMGGRLAYLWAAESPNLKGAAIFYGGNIMVQWGDVEPAPLAKTQRIQCPIIGFFGNEDTNPSPDDVTAISDALNQAGKPHEFHRYDGAGHAFLNTMRPSFRAHQAADAWERCVVFLRARRT